MSDGKGKDKPAPPIAGLENALVDRLGALGGVLEMAGDEYCAGILEQRARPWAEAAVKVAKRNIGFRRFLVSLTTGSEMGELIFLSLSIAVPMAAHHGYLPAEAANFFTLGIVAPPPSEEVAAEAAARARRTEPPPAAEGYPAPGDPIPAGPHYVTHDESEPEPFTQPEGNVIELGEVSEAAEPDGDGTASPG